MKCVQNIVTKEIRRVNNERAEEMVDMGALGERSGIFWTYIKKEVWKKEHRDPKIAASTVTAIVDAPTNEVKAENKKSKKEYQKARKVRTNN